MTAYLIKLKYSEKEVNSPGILKWCQENFTLQGTRWGGHESNFVDGVYYGFWFTHKEYELIFLLKYGEIMEKYTRE